MSESTAFDLASLDDLPERQEEGRDVEIKHPATGEVVMTIRVVGLDSRRGRRAQEKASTAAMRAMRVRRPSAGETDELLTQQMAEVCTGWDAVMGGEPYPFTAQNAVALLTKHRWIREQVEAAHFDRASFMQA